MGNNSVPKFIFRLSRFPIYRGSVLGRFYCTCNSHTRCCVATATIQPNQFCRKFRPLHSFFLILTVQCNASADPLTVYKAPPCWDPTAYVTNRLYCIILSYLVSVSENSQTTATQISQNMQQSHCTVQNTKNCVIIVLRIRDIKHTVKTRYQALMIVAIQVKKSSPYNRPQRPRGGIEV